MNKKDPCRCPACQCAEEANEPLNAFEAPEPTGPLSAVLLADYADQLADSLADFADELNLFHVKYEMDASHFKQQAKRLVDLAKQLREES